MDRTITASKGYVLTDGKVYGKIIYLGEDVDASAFHEITREEYDAIMAEQNTDELPIGIDRETALKAEAYDIIMGVSE